MIGETWHLLSISKSMIKNTIRENFNLQFQLLIFFNSYFSQNTFFVGYINLFFDRVWQRDTSHYLLPVCQGEN